jgi:hypothetical protein
VQVLDIVAGKVDDTRPPVVLVVVEVVLQLIGELGQVEEVVLGSAQFQLGVAAGLAARVDQLRWLQQLAAVVALVTPGISITAVGAFALDVAVGQEAALLRAIELPLDLFVQVAVLQDLEKDVLGDAVVVLGVGVGEQVEGQPICW